MDNLPDWLGNVLYAALGGLGALGLGLIRARVDSARIRLDDRAHFTDQVVARLSAVERQMQEEREYCEKRMNLMKSEYEQRLDKRDVIITELRERDVNREQRLSQLEKIVQGLD